ncbi:hypothetical protein [Leptolyngbya sp. AN10]|uniref:hypothetical protein n=1 Tax=Leptolyngbya sp. AN10 TaxID=3423365 RepID=UPI003D312D5A
MSSINLAESRLVWEEVFAANPAVRGFYPNYNDEDIDHGYDYVGVPAPEKPRPIARWIVTEQINWLHRELPGTILTVEQAKAEFWDKLPTDLEAAYTAGWILSIVNRSYLWWHPYKSAFDCELRFNSTFRYPVPAEAQWGAPIEPFDFDHTKINKEGHSWINELQFYKRNELLVTLKFTHKGSYHFQEVVGNCRQYEPQCYAYRGHAYSKEHAIVLGVRDFITPSLCNHPMLEDWEKYIPVARAFAAGRAVNGVLYFGEEGYYNPRALRGEPLLQVCLQYGAGSYTRETPSPEGLQRLMTQFGGYQFEDALARMSRLLELGETGEIVDVQGGRISIIDGRAQAKSAEAYYRPITNNSRANLQLFCSTKTKPQIHTQQHGQPMVISASARTKNTRTCALSADATKPRRNSARN